jgi:D-glycero-D-manno-heptose 1,7-bisphosphate phosphatase
VRPRLSEGGAVFLDRDGTINVSPPPGEYVVQPDQVALLPGAGAAIAAINRAGHRVIVVTNQRGVALGRMSEDDLARVHERLRALLQRGGATLDDILFCPHNLGECDCRKPGTRMFRDAQERWPDIDLGESIMIGDSDIDAQAAAGVGIPAIQLGADAPDLLSAVDTILEARR